MTGSAASSRAPGRLTIDLGALADNWRRLAARAAPGRCAAVVKANAYGIGVAEAAPALWAAGARVFFVAHLSEGVAARQVLPEAAIYVLNGLETTADPADYAGHRLAPVIGDEKELRRWSAFAARSGRTSPCALHLDTGMNRLGFELLARLRAAMEADGAASGADLLMSHFVSSEFADDPINAAQIERFDAARAAFPSLPASLANSSGMFLGARPSYDLARPGYALYGGNPTPGAANPMRPVVTLAIAIQQTRWIEAGHDLRLQRPMDRQAPYAARDPARRLRRRPAARRRRDGCKGGRRSRDRRPPLPAGRARVDGPDDRRRDRLPENAAQPGDLAEFFGSSVDLDEFAARSGTIGYHVLTSLGPRYRREYLR